MPGKITHHCCVCQAEYEPATDRPEGFTDDITSHGYCDGCAAARELEDNISAALAEYHYRSAHAQTTVDVLAVRDDALAKIVAAVRCALSGLR